MLDLDQISTPAELSMDEAENASADNQDSEDSDKKPEKRHEEYLVRTKKAPKFRFAKNKYDAYLTKTSLRAIKFSENKKRWQRLIDNDLYSKT